MVFSGLAMIVVGAWLAAQAIGGNLAGRIRSWASSQFTPGAVTSSTTSRSSGGGTRTGGGGSGGGATVK